MNCWLRAVLTTFSVVGATTCLCTAALADCKPLAFVTSVDLVSAGYDNVKFAPVTIGGLSKLMLVDTGGSISEISSPLVDALKLSRKQSAIAQYDISGHKEDWLATTSFQLGSVKSREQQFIVSSDDGFYKDDRIGGILEPDILRYFDVNLDYGAGKLTLLSQDHCEGKVIYWPHDALAIVPMHLLESNHVMIRVTLDGQSVNAMIDTGASRSTLTVPAAVNYFGLKLGSPDAPEAGTLSGDGSPEVYRHTFKALDFDGIAVSNPNLEIVPNFLGDLAAGKQVVGTHIPNSGNSDDKINMIIGMDILKHLHLYIAYGEQKLYITPADAPRAAAAAIANGK